MKMDDDQKRFEGTMAAVDEAMLAATRAEIAEGLRALGIDPTSATSGMRASRVNAPRMVEIAFLPAYWAS